LFSRLEGDNVSVSLSMGTPSRTRRFVRTEIPATEKWIGGVIVLLLLGIAWGVQYKGTNYEPGIFEVDAAALASTSEAITGVAATLREAPTVASVQPQGLDRALPEYGLPLKAMGPTELYNAETLFEKINGRAPAYIEFSFQELTTRSFSLTQQNGQFIDIFIFWMDQPLSAFGIFSLERDPTAAAVDFASDGYRSEMGYFFRTGRAYVQIIASSPEAEVMDVAATYAGYLAERLPADDSGMEARLSLPSYGQVPGSVAFVAQNAYGQELLKEVFQAKYQFEGTELSYFAMQAADDAKAGEVWQALLDFNAKFGEVQPSYEVGGATVFEAENFGEYTVVAQQDGLVSGIVNAADLANAKQFMEHAIQGSFPEGGAVIAPAVEELPDEAYGEEDY